MNCDRIASLYKWLEYAAFGRALERRRRRYLHLVAQATNVLLLGDGDGRFTAELVATIPHATVCSVDLSTQMLRLAKRRLEQLGTDLTSVSLIKANALDIALVGPYDLIVTHFFLDCFTSLALAPLVSRVSQAASPTATWLISEFRVPSPPLMNLFARFLIKAMYLFFRITTGLKTSQLPRYESALCSHRFRRLQASTAAGGLLISELWKRDAE